MKTAIFLGKAIIVVMVMAALVADGTYSLSLARNGIYRAAVGTAGSQAWIA